MRSTQGVPQKLKVIYLSHNIPKIILSRQNFQFRPAINLSQDHVVATNPLGRLLDKKHTQTGNPNLHKEEKTNTKPNQKKILFS